jgi:hypothetical protein
MDQVAQMARIARIKLTHIAAAIHRDRPPAGERMLALKRALSGGHHQAPPAPASQPAGSSAQPAGPPARSAGPPAQE